MSSPSASPPVPPSGVIHDIGYRGYSGPRLGRGAIGRALFSSSLRSTYGLGRTGKSKVLPFILVGCILIPAIVVEAVLIFVRNAMAAAGGGEDVGFTLSAQPIHYTGYVIVTQAVLGVFLAAQAPQLFSRDLRFRTTSLYFSRPLTRFDYVVSKYLALVGGLFLLMAAPLLVMFGGGLMAKLPLGNEIKGLLQGLTGALILALLLAGIGALISSLTVRRGFAVAAIITVGAVGFALAATLIGIGYGVGSEALRAVGGLVSPITLLDGLQYVIFGQNQLGLYRPEGAWQFIYLAVTAVYMAGGFLLVLRRYRKVSGA